MISQFALECALTTAFGSACCQEEVPDSAVLMNSGFLPVTWLDLGIVWGFSKLKARQPGPVEGVTACGREWNWTIFKVTLQPNHYRIL